MIAEFFTAIFDAIIWSDSWRFYAQIAWKIALVFAALIWGGAPEKIVIFIWLFASEIQRILRGIFPEGPTAFEKWSTVNEVSLFGETVLLIGFVALALNANRQYLLWIAAIQIIAFMTHGVRALSDELTIFVYLLLTIGSGWLQIFIMTAGQIAHVRREPGRYPDWRWQVKTPRLGQPAS